MSRGGASGFDRVSMAAAGLRGRRARTALSILGVAIGVAAVLAVVGISASSRAELLARIDALGTNLLTVSPARGAEDTAGAIPPEADAMVRRIGPVQQASAIAAVADGDQPATVRRSPAIPAPDTGGLSVVAASPDLLGAVGGTVRAGRFLDIALERYPVAVLGSYAAAALGVDLAAGPTTVVIADRLFSVAGILAPVGLAPELDRAALIGYPEAATLGPPGATPVIVTLYVRTDPAATAQVQAVLGQTTNPAHLDQISVSRPSGALAARAAADQALTTLLVTLGAVALVVGGLGVANTMVIAVLERRSEIGLRRALGATRADIGIQLLFESTALAALGAVIGIALGVAVTTAWSLHQGWQATIPAAAVAAALGSAIVVGAVAGLYPARRAARLTPTEALRAP